MKAEKDVKKIKLVAKDLKEDILPSDIDSKRLPSLTNPSLTNYTEEVPEKHKGEVRILSYNIMASFCDNRDKTIDARHHWKNRAPYVEKLLKTPLATEMDVLCLQEVSPKQGLDIENMLGKDYFSVFLVQAPSEVKAGALAYGEEIKEWYDKFVGTSLLAIYVNKARWKFADGKADKFWLKEEPDKVPEPEMLTKEEFESDRKAWHNNKGFGTNVYRTVLWAKLVSNDNAEQEFFIFNSLYPLSGGSKTRLKCAQLELQKIKEITKGAPWVSTGDRNLISDDNDTGEYNPEIVYQALVGPYKDIRDSAKHYGSHATWLGFSFDKYKSHIKSGDVVPALATEKATVLDVMISNKLAKLSFHYPVAYTPTSAKAKTDELEGSLETDVPEALASAVAIDSGELLAISVPLPDSLDIDRYFASDHTLIGADFDLFD